MQETFRKSTNNYRSSVHYLSQCSVGPDFSCSFPGCNQARKLTSHYRRCRDLRLRATPDRPYNCLVCSLLAREVRKFQHEEEVAARAKHAQQQKQRRMMQQHSAPTSGVRVTASGGKPMSTSPMTVPSNSLSMPPPPSRPPISHSLSQKKSYLFDAPTPSSYGSPPTIPEHMKKNLNKVANIVHFENKSVAHLGVISRPQMLSKSYDTSTGIGSSFGGRRSKDDSDYTLDSQSPKSKKRERSVSVGDVLDVISSPPRNHARKFAREVEAENEAYAEWQERSTTSGEKTHQQFVVPPTLARRRSSSCGVIASMVRGGGFAAIPEVREEDFESGGESGGEGPDIMGHRHRDSSIDLLDGGFSFEGEPEASNTKH